MNHATGNEFEGSRRLTKPGSTTASRLLQAVTAGGSIELGQLASRMGVAARRLYDCRDGIRQLDLEEQIVLAALVMLLSPPQARLAQHLHAQAQSALRVREGLVESHLVYPRPYSR